MAINTVPDPVRVVDTKTYTFYGFPVPKNVTAIESQRRVDDDMLVVRWRVKDDPNIHSIELPVVTDETVMAALAAMRLS